MTRLSFRPPIWGLTTLILSSLFHCSHADTKKSQQENAFIILGPALVPEYMGGDDYSSVPMLVSQFQLGHSEIEIEGLTTQASLFEYEKWHFGLSTNIDTGRDDSVEDAAIASMQQIKAAFNIGGFAAYNEDHYFLADDNVEFKIAMYTDANNAHNGAFSTMGLTYTMPLHIPWRFEFELETTYGNDNYINTYFSVDRNDSLNSGLSQYNTNASFRDISFNTNIGLFLSPKWGAFLRLGASRLLDDAADSPVTATGNKNQYFIGLGVFYRFGE